MLFYMQYKVLSLKSKEHHVARILQVPHPQREKEQIVYVPDS